jgi:membrane-associated phospholipid phosphatase
MSASAEPRVETRRGPNLVALAISFWLAAAAFFCFLAVCAVFYDYFPADLRIAHWIQDIDVPGFGGFMHFVNFVGNTSTYLVLLVLLVIAFGVVRAGWEAVLVLLTLIPASIDSVLKELIRRPRPSRELVQVTGNETDYSFPSGHTLKIAALFIVLFFAIPAIVPWRPVRWLLQAGCLLFVVSAGPARVYIGVHWPSDTLASYLLVFLVLGPPLALYARYRRTEAESER